MSEYPSVQGNNKINRRQFLQRCAAWGVALGTMGWKPFPVRAEKLEKAATADIDSGQPDLAVVKGTDASLMVEQALHLLGGMEHYVKKGGTVVLKPNFSFPRSPAMGATTSPEVVRAVIRLCLRAGAGKVLVTDHPLASPDNCARASGIKDVVQEFKGVSLLLGDRESLYQSRSVTKGDELKEVKVLIEAADADSLINLPTAKSHSATGVSLSLKNLMGLIWDRGYFHTRIDLNQGIADLASMIRPQLTIMDASRALTSGGPGGPGKVEAVNTIIAGVDPVAIDSYTVSSILWYGRKFEGRQVKHILAAHRLGVGEMDLGKLTVVQATVA